MPEAGVTDENRSSDSTIEPRLRPIVARLAEIERKCRGIGPRNEEAREMAARLQSVISELSRPPGEGVPQPYGELARQLFPVARLFESLGFMSVAREVAHVDRLLTEMDPESAHPPPASPAALPIQPAATETERDPDDTEPSAAEIVEADRPRTPPVVIVSLIVLALAVIASVAVVLRQRSDVERATAGAPGRGVSGGIGLEPTPPPQTPLEASPVARPTLGPRSRLADLVGEARLAYQDDRLDEAISLLSQAGSIDPKATLVLETADQLVAELIRRADAAADAAEWQTASDLLERARELAVRFELSTRPIDDAARRHGDLVHYRRLRPDDRAGLESLIGKRIVVITEGGPSEGTLRGLESSSLRLELGLEIGDDGALIHTVEVPLRLVREVRVYAE